jgi:hypothetical protein
MQRVQMQINKLSLALAILLIGISFVSASASIKIDMKDSFTIGDNIFLNFTITSASAERVTYFVSFDCPNSPIPLIELKNATTPITDSYTYLTVDATTEPQTCRVSVSILNPYEKQESKNFTIVSDPSFNFQILTCEEQTCTNPTRIFVRGKDVYFNYKSNISASSVTATLTYPDKTAKQLVLPASVNAEQIGTYTLEATAVKSSYKTATEKIQFGVIEKEAQIEYTSLQDLKATNKRDATIKIILYSAIGAFVLLIAVILFFIIRKRNSKKKI